MLKEQISGRALVLVESLEISKQSYLEAKNLLTSALASPISQKYDAIKRLLDLNFPYAKDPYTFISEMRIIGESFKNLKIDIEMILQFCFWRAMNDTMQNQMVQITNKSKPSLLEIESNLFEATERYLSVTNKFNERKQKLKSSVSDATNKTINSYAVNVNYDPSNKQTNKFRACLLCSTDKCIADHPIYKCETYKNAKDKVTQIKVLKGCEKCANLNHRTSECRFRFHSSCRYCHAWHFSFLCIHPVEEGGKQREGKKNEKEHVKINKQKDIKNQNKIESSKEVNSGVIWIEAALYSNSYDNSILPTFTCNLGNHIIRAMKDSGCQENFIPESLAYENNLKVIDSNIEITINGFNGSKDYKTKKVELNLILGRNEHVITAICVPSINTKIKLSNLNKVVSKFKEKGYEFADKFLDVQSESIGNFDLILGTDDAHCLPVHEIVYGSSMSIKASVFMNTNIGIMLEGNLDRMLQNLDYLPNLKCSETHVHVSDVEKENFTKTNNVIDDACMDNKVNKDSSNTQILNDDHEQDEQNMNFTVINEHGEVNEKELLKATNAILNGHCEQYLKYDNEIDEFSIENNNMLSQYALDKIESLEDGRLQVPILWNGRVSHLLGKNFNLAKQILKAPLKKLSRNKEKLLMTDKVFKDQVEQGIIEKLDNIDDFIVENPQCSFLPHMSVIKMDRETTKCRVVFLSNLCEKNKNSYQRISHNQAIQSGPNLNKKISISLILLRFDKFLICFDIAKAFLQLALNVIDQNRLMFLWFRNIEKDDFSIIGYRNKRLPFGISCSPSLLMLSLFYILIIETNGNSDKVKNFKKLVYSLMYMDNGAYTSNDEMELKSSHKLLIDIFNQYQFSLQQFSTNSTKLQDYIDESVEERTSDKIKLFGLLWDRCADTLSTKKLNLDSNANTKRFILATLAKNFDPFNYNGPLLNRARTFMHDLQCEKTLDWNTELSKEQLKEWKNISKQLNSSPEIHLKRFIGKRNATYRLISFTDSSKTIYGTVIFIQDVDSLNVSFLLAKNRFVNRQLESKSIPCLELHAVILGTEVLIDLYTELAGYNSIVPLNIIELKLYTDSMVSLNWINSFIIKLEKMQQKRTIFVMNRLSRLSRLCEIFPVHYSFVAGCENPADHITRSVSYKQLKKSNYFCGPEFLKGSNGPYTRDDILTVTVPNPSNDTVYSQNKNEQYHILTASTEKRHEHLLPLEKYSSFSKFVSVHRYILKFINNMKLSLKGKDPDKYSHLSCYDLNANLYAEAISQIILTDQNIHFSDAFKYFSSKSKRLKDMPNIVGQLNAYPDNRGLLRVKSKCMKGSDKNQCYFPLLLSKHSLMTRLIILDLHRKLFHAGKYVLLTELRKKFWVPQYFSLVKGTLRECTTCKRFNERTIKLNQSPYREFRINPPNVPFKFIFLDYLGPYNVNWNGKRNKVWILCITCLWSRAINLKVCLDLTNSNFLKAFQLHTFEFGLPELILSDLGSQIVACSNIIMDFIKDPETQLYFQETGVKSPTFDQYYKGNSSQGSLVESCVKLIKRLIYGSIKNYVLDFIDFQFLIAKTVHLVNRRPIAFKEALRDNSLEEVPEPITPEMLLRGYNLTSINVIPDLQPEIDNDPDWMIDPVDSISDGFSKLRHVRENLICLYNEEFVSNLINQAVNSKDRYKPVKHKHLQKGDIVLLKEKHLKVSNYPLGVIKEIQVNTLNEVTGALVLKGKTKELVKRHSSSIIPILTNINEDSETSKVWHTPTQQSNLIPVRPKRNAAKICTEKNKILIDSEIF